MLRYVMVRLKWKTALTILSGRVFQFHYSVFHIVDRLFVFKEDPNYEASLSLPNCGIAKNTLYDMRHMSLISICTIRFHNICRRNESTNNRFIYSCFKPYKSIFLVMISQQNRITRDVRRMIGERGGGG